MCYTRLSDADAFHLLPMGLCHFAEVCISAKECLAPHMELAMVLTARGEFCSACIDSHSPMPRGSEIIVVMGQQNGRVQHLGVLSHRTMQCIEFYF